MSEMTHAVMIWNRACGEDPVRSFPGDRALVDMIRAHGLVMNGGVLHAIDCLTSSELSDAEDAYRYYGLDRVAALLARSRTILETVDDLDDHEEEFDGQYADLIPSDSSLIECFEKRLKSNPSDYRALQAKDMT